MTVAAPRGLEPQRDRLARGGRVALRRDDVEDEPCLRRGRRAELEVDLGAERGHQRRGGRDDDRAGPADDPDTEAAVGEDRAGLVERLAREQRGGAQPGARRAGLPVAVDRDDREDAHVGGVERPEVDLGLAGSERLRRDPVDVQEGGERLARSVARGLPPERQRAVGLELGDEVGGSGDERQGRVERAAAGRRCGRGDPDHEGDGERAGLAGGVVDRARERVRAVAQRADVERRNGAREHRHHGGCAVERSAGDGRDVLARGDRDHVRGRDDRAVARATWRRRSGRSCRSARRRSRPGSCCRPRRSRRPAGRRARPGRPSCRSSPRRVRSRPCRSSTRTPRRPGCG